MSPPEAIDGFVMMLSTAKHLNIARRLKLTTSLHTTSPGSRLPCKRKMMDQAHEAVN